MTEFVAMQSTSLSIGGTASFVASPAPANNARAADDLSISLGARTATHVKIHNTHATQVLYAKAQNRSGTAIAAAASDHIVIIPAGTEVIMALKNFEGLSMIASGATTTGVAHFGGMVK
jgi:hypothetical protein